MEDRAGNGSRDRRSVPLDTVSRSEGIEKRPDGVKPFGRVEATEYDKFRSFG